MRQQHLAEQKGEIIWNYIYVKWFSNFFISEMINMSNLNTAALS